MLKWIPWIGVAWLFAGCAAAPLIPAASSFLPGGTANADFHSGTVTKLEGANFVVLQTNVTGHCKGFALLGLITLTPARFTTALDQLYGAAGMRPGRAQT